MIEVNISWGVMSVFLSTECIKRFLKARILLNQVVKGSGNALEANVLCTLIKSWESKVWNSEKEILPSLSGLGGLRVALVIRR